MMKNSLYLILLLTTTIFSSCDIVNSKKNKGNKVLILKVDYQTNTFTGATESYHNKKTDSFTLKTLYIPPSDFGCIKVNFQEINHTIFNASIIWNGKGKIESPSTFNPSSNYKKVQEKNIVNPINGFENIFAENFKLDDYTPIWLAIQNLEIVRDYLANNPKEKVKLFLYTPSVGLGNPAEWEWIIFLKN